MPKYQKYSPEMEKELSVAYQGATTTEERSEVVQTYVEKWGKPERSIIAKLSKMKVYVPKERVSSVTGGPARTKEQIVKDIARLIKVEPYELSGMEKSPKLALQKVKTYLLSFNKGLGG